MHPEYTIYLNSYKERLDAFSREYKKDGVRCLPRILAENEWGGKDKLALGMSRNECWLKEVDGVEYVEWRTMSQGKEGGTVRTFGVQGQRKVTSKEFDEIVDMVDQSRFDWKLCKASAKALKNEGEVEGDLKERLSKAACGLEKGAKTAEKMYTTLRGLKEQEKLSEAGISAMKTLGENIKARLHRVHHYCICCNTHRCNFNYFMITADHHSPPTPPHSLFLISFATQIDGRFIVDLGSK